MVNKKAIIIGAGIAGLATATRLACLGMEVDVFEKNDLPGGKLTAFSQEGFHFDAGPSLFTQPELIRELFELADEPIASYFKYAPVEIACYYFFPSGKQVLAYTDKDRFDEELAVKTGEERGTVLKYLDNAARLYGTTGVAFLDHPVHRVKDWFNSRVLRALRSAKPVYLVKDLNAYNRSHFQTPEAVQLFNRFATYSGSDPFNAPSMLSVVPHIEHNEGVYFPEGGMHSITNALYKLAVKKGVRFHFGKPVQRIIHHEGRIRGITSAGRNHEADVVISNVDIHFTYKHLLNDPHRAKSLARKERSSSAIVFYWGMNKRFPQLGLHNIFFSADYKAEFNDIFRFGRISNDPTVYVNITSNLETAHAPTGKENWFVMVNTSANRGQDWSNLTKLLRQRVIEKLSAQLGEDISDCIETEATLDPVSMEAQTNAFSGAIYGNSSNSRKAAFFRPPNYSKHTRGLFFCGGTVHPGGGIPLCLRSARIVSELIKSGKYV